MILRQYIVKSKTVRPFAHKPHRNPGLVCLKLACNHGASILLIIATAEVYSSDGRGEVLLLG